MDPLITTLDDNDEQPIIDDKPDDSSLTITTTIAKPDPIITHVKPDFDSNYSQDSLIYEQEPDQILTPHLESIREATTAPIVETELVETEMYQPKDHFEHVESSSSHHQIENADLADFEIPQFTSSNTTTEHQQQQKRQSKDLDITTPNVTVAKSSSSSCSPNLSAVKNLLIANYSRVSHVLHWKDPIETGIIFGIGSAIILALTFFSIISVFAYSGLGLILGSTSIRVYKVIMKMLNMPTETRFDNIWNNALGINVSLSPKRIHNLVDDSLETLNDTLSYIKRVLLVEDKFATITFGLFLYVLTYLGSWFNGMTLITLLYLCLFSLPVIYEKNKSKIDDYVNLASNHVSTTVSLVSKKVSTLASGSSHGVSSSSSEKQD